MLQYILLGLALGSIYAIAAAGIVVTFASAGVLNLAFGSMAHVVAPIYYWLNSQQRLVLDLRQTCIRSDLFTMGSLHAPQPTSGRTSTV